MKTRRIEAADMQSALKIARTELGDAAVLLDSKKSKNGISVVFAIEHPDEYFFDDQPISDADIPTPFAPDIPRSATAKAEIAHPALPLIIEALDQQGIPVTFKEKLIKRLHHLRFTAGALADVAERGLSEALADLLAFKPIATGASAPPNRAIMLVGMHGAGKTSAIAKLATELVLNKQRVVLVSCDNERMGAADNLQNLSSILKCGFHLAEDRAALKPLIKQYQDQAWLLIDSAGVNCYEFQQLKALGELGSLQGIESILTCPAGIDPEEAAEMAAALDFLNIDRMIVTKADAARRFGSVFAAIAGGGLAIANISSSARPTESCSPASAPALARLILRHARERMAA